MKTLPTLALGEEFICDSGCGTTTPVLKEFEYSREEFDDGHVISKTRPEWFSSCCSSNVCVYRPDDSIVDIEDYVQKVS